MNTIDTITISELEDMAKASSTGDALRKAALTKFKQSRSYLTDSQFKVKLIWFVVENNANHRTINKVLTDVAAEINGQAAFWLPAMDEQVCAAAFDALLKLSARS